MTNYDTTSMDKTVAIIKAVSDKNRLRILNALSVHHELCACQITELLGVSGATVSKHLARMVKAGVLINRKQGRWIYFRLNRMAERAPLFEWITSQTKRSLTAQTDLQALSNILQFPCEELCLRQRQNGSCEEAAKT